MTSFWKTIEPFIDKLIDERHDADRDVLGRNIVERLEEEAFETATEKQFSFLPPAASGKEISALRYRAEVVGEMVVCAARHRPGGNLAAFMPPTGENFWWNGDCQRDWMLGDLIASYIKHCTESLCYPCGDGTRHVAYAAERAIDSAAIWSRLFDGPNQDSEEWQSAMRDVIHAVNVNTVEAAELLARQEQALREEQERLHEEKQNCLDKEKPLPFFAS